jgi:hypothetical protein
MSLRDPIYRNPQGYDRIQIGRAFGRRHGMPDLPADACSEIAYMLEIGWRESSVAADLAARYPECVEPEPEREEPDRRPVVVSHALRVARAASACFSLRCLLPLRIWR